VASSTRSQQPIGAKSAFSGSSLRASSVRLASAKPVAATASTITADQHRATKQYPAKASTELLDSTDALGPDLFNKSYYPKLEDHQQINKPWYIVDAEGKTLGRLACLIAGHLRGSNLPTYSPSVDMGGYVVVINAEKVTVTGNKASQKLYRRHTTGRPGSMKVETFTQMQARIPERIVEKAVKGMLPKGRLGRTLFTHMKVFEGDDHPHAAQQPMDITSQIDKSYRTQLVQK
jgi:large subunit ribosomal protein L13